MSCSMFHTGIDCSETYAEALGSSYSQIQIFYAVVVITISALTFTSTVVIVHRRKLLPLDSQKRMFYLACGLCTTLIVRSVDPANWRLWLPPTLSQLLTDWGSAFLYSIVFCLVHEWIRVVIRVTSGNREKLSFTAKFFTFLHAFIWFPFTLLSVLESNENHYYVWRSIKLFVGAMALALICSLQTYYGSIIFKTLKANEALIASPSMTSLKAKGSKIALSATKTSKINKIKYLLIAYGVGDLVVIVAQLYSAKTGFASQTTLSNPGAPPSSSADVLAELVFDFLQMVGVFALVVFFHPPINPSDPSEQEESKGQSAQVTPRAKTSVRSARPGHKSHQPSIASITVNSCSSSEQDKLPPGWEKLVNEQGLVYYHNSDKNISVWDHPCARATNAVIDGADDGNSPNNNNERSLVDVIPPQVDEISISIRGHELEGSVNN